MRSSNTIDEKWLRENGFMDNPDSNPFWRQENPKYKFDFCLILPIYGGGIWVEREEGGMWLGGVYYTSSKKHLCTFHESPAPSKTTISCLAQGVFRKKIGPTSLLSVSLSDHGINAPMLKKVLLDASNQHRMSVAAIDHDDIDPANEMYWNNVLALIDVLK